MEATGGAFQVHTEQVEEATLPSPLGIQIVDNHNNWRSPSWLDPIAQSRIHITHMLPAKAPSHASDSQARWEGSRGEAVVCVVLLPDANVYIKKNNHMTDGWMTKTHKPAVIAGPTPSVKTVLTGETAGCCETTHTRYLCQEIALISIHYIQTHFNPT